MKQLLESPFRYSAVISLILAAFISPNLHFLSLETYLEMAKTQIIYGIFCYPVVLSSILLIKKIKNK